MEGRAAEGVVEEAGAVVAAVCRALGSGRRSWSCRWSGEISRPKTRPTVEAPRAVAVAQSCITADGQYGGIVAVAGGATWAVGGWSRRGATALKQRGAACKEVGEVAAVQQCSSSHGPTRH